MTHEIDTDSRDIGLGVGVIGESQEQTRLSNAGISDEEELEEIVVSEGACQKAENPIILMRVQGEVVAGRSCVSRIKGSRVQLCK